MIHLHYIVNGLLPVLGAIGGAVLFTLGVRVCPVLTFIALIIGLAYIAGMTV